MSQCCFCGCPHPCISKYADLFDSNQFLNRCALLRLIDNLKKKNETSLPIINTTMKNNLLTGPEIQNILVV